MPKGKRDRIKANSLATRIRVHLLTNPGGLTPRQIAQGLGQPEDRTPSQWSIDVGRELSRMKAKGWVNSHPLTDKEFAALDPADRKGPRPALYTFASPEA